MTYRIDPPVLPKAWAKQFCTQYPRKDWHQRLGSGVDADAIMDRIVHRTVWIETGSTNMREHDAANPTP